MEKITATFMFVTLIGALLVIASATESQPGNVTDTSPVMTKNNSTKTSPNNFTTPANMKSEGNTTTPMNVTTATPKTNLTKDVLITTPRHVSNVTPKTNQTTGANATTPKRDSETTPNTNRTRGDTQTPGPEKLTPPTATPKRPKTVTTPKAPVKPPKPPHKEEHSASTTYIIIIIVIILCVTGAIAYCCYQNKTRTFSLDRTSKSEDAHIPLSAVEPEVFEASASKDMETFAATETTGTAESAPPAEAVEKKEEEKAPAAPAEATQPEKESSAETQATVPLVEKPGELTVVDLNDGEQTVSNKTSMETLEETPNENNSNNRAQALGWHMSGANGNFIEITLDDVL